MHQHHHPHANAQKDDSHTVSVHPRSIQCRADAGSHTVLHAYMMYACRGGFTNYWKGNIEKSEKTGNNNPDFPWYNRVCMGVDERKWLAER